MRSAIPAAAILLLFSGWPLQQTQPTEGAKSMSLKKLTPVLFVEEIEPSLKFWMDHMGFVKSVEVPESDPSSASSGLRASKLGFIILQEGNIELMYQSYASVEKDMPAIAATVRQGPTFLYVEVASLDPILPTLQAAGVEIYMPVRETFYGMREIGIREPGGHYVTFAAPVAGAAPKP